MLVLMSVDEITTQLSADESKKICDTFCSRESGTASDFISSALFYQRICEIAVQEGPPYFSWELDDGNMHYTFVIIGNKDDVARKLGQRIEALLPPFTL